MSSKKDFKTCQFCHVSNEDICHFRMWQECDEQARPIPDKMLITCKKDKCFQILDDLPQLFIEVPWSQGGPGKFMLLCGDCQYRQEYACLHPHLKQNGGDGLSVHFSKTPISSVRMCTTDGRSITFGMPASECEGNPNTWNDARFPILQGV